VVFPDGLWAHAFRCHYQRLRRLAYLLGSNDPDGAVIDAFIKAERAPSTIQEAGALAYLDTAVRSVVRDEWRHRRGVREMSLGSVEELEVHLSPHEDDIHDSRSELMMAVRGLPRRQQEVIVLRHLVGLKGREVAQILGIQATAVRKAEQIALATLRKLDVDRHTP
jgi:RNA polymerase sigma factor (sigma-70 family)